MLKLNLEQIHKFTKKKLVAKIKKNKFKVAIFNFFGLLLISKKLSVID
jgi:hypothetical protein